MDQKTGEATLHSPISIQLPGQAQPIMINPADLQGLGGKPGQGLLQMQNSGFGSASMIDDDDFDSDGDGDVLDNGTTRLHVPPSFVVSEPDDNDSANRLRIPANFMTSGTESDNESEVSKKRSAQLLVSKFAKMGGEIQKAVHIDSTSSFNYVSYNRQQADIPSVMSLFCFLYSHKKFIQ